MRDGHDGRAPLTPQGGNGGKHLVRPLGVEHGGSLVEHDEVGRAREDAGKRHALLLPAGELVDVGTLHAGKPHGGKRRGRGGLGLARRGAEVERAKRHVLPHDRGDELVLGALEHHAAAVAKLPSGLGRSLVSGDGKAADGELALLQSRERVQVPSERRLAAAVCAHNGHERAGRDVQVNAAQVSMVAGDGAGCGRKAPAARLAGSGQRIGVPHAPGAHRKAHGLLACLSHFALPPLLPSPSRTQRRTIVSRPPGRRTGRAN